MARVSRDRWLFRVAAAGLLYLLIGITFAVPTTHVRVWRLSAWFVSALVYAVHIAYECVWRHTTPRVTAVRAAVGAGLGAFGLAVVGAVHSLSTTSTLRAEWLLAFVLWPSITAIPAFVVALVVVVVMTRVMRGGLATWGRGNRRSDRGSKGKEER